MIAHHLIRPLAGALAWLAFTIVEILCVASTITEPRHRPLFVAVAVAFAANVALWFLAYLQ